MVNPQVSASAKDLALEWVGVIFLLIGLFLSIASLEISGWFEKVAYPKKIESASE